MTIGKSARIICGFVALLLTTVLPDAAVSAEGVSGVGQAIYRYGVLPGGEPLVANREAGVSISGASAACINCHRRSGLGATEGRSTIPPITGRYLFHPRAQTLDDLDLPFVEGARADRDPYTDETLARAIRQGIASDGHDLSYLMPHYALDDSAMEQLIAYLKRLSRYQVPGVDESVLHFATIITPDADPVKRQGMLNVLTSYFNDKNAFTRAQSPKLRSTRRMMYRVNRTWQLHVWELTGSPDTWQAQLTKRLAMEPVLAVISGIGGKTWMPVHRFCQQESLPCLFPNVELPVDAEQDFYSIYFSKGVLLEAQLIASRLAVIGSDMPLRRIIQVARAGDIGEQAAQAFSSAKHPVELKITTRTLKAKGAEQDLRTALKDVGPSDALILWLRPGDLTRLANLPVHTDTVFISGLMGDLGNAPLPPDWRTVTCMAYPFDLPNQRRVRLDYPLGWFALRRIPVVAEQVQTDTYLAVGILAETLNHMVDTFERDYLIERVEGMLEHRIITGYYPRLALATNQRFASKGGYLMKFKDPTGPRLVAVSDWLIP